MKDVTFFEEKLNNWNREKKEREQKIAELHEKYSAINRQIDEAADRDDSLLVEDLERKLIDLDLKINALERINDRRSSNLPFDEDELRDANNDIVDHYQKDIDKLLTATNKAFIAYMESVHEMAMYVLKAVDNRKRFSSLAGYSEIDTPNDFKKIRLTFFLHPSMINKYEKSKPTEAADIRRFLHHITIG